jgi:hypothetical protein
MGDDRQLLQRHPRFVGDIDHLRRFSELASTSIVSDARGRALAEWRAFNTVPADSEQVRLAVAKRAADPGRPMKAQAPKATTPARKTPVRKVASWTAYRGKRGVDLRGVDFPGLILGTVDLGQARLDNSNFHATKFRGACLKAATLRNADLEESLLLGADLRECDLREAKMAGANLRESDLSGAVLDGADLTGADLSYAGLVGTSIADACLDDCRVYGTAAWNVVGEPRSSDNLVITPETEPALLVDKLKLAQFMYLLLENAELRDVIDTLTSKSVLLLGRFTPERKATLDELRRALRAHGYTPVMFDFDKPNSKTVSDTVRLLAQIARYVVVDLTDPASAPYEVGLLMGIGLRTTPLVPIIGLGERPFSMIDDVVREDWVLPLIRYADTADLLARLDQDIVKPAEMLMAKLRKDIEPGFG